MNNMPDTSTDQLLKSLESNYVKGEYDKALDLLLENRNLFDSGLYHFNLGTLYIKKKDYPIGRFHLEKSLKDGFYTKELKKNLSTVKTILERGGAVDPMSGEGGFIRTMKELPESYYFLATGFVLLLWSLLLVKKIPLRKTLMTLLFIISFLPFGFKKLYLSQFNFGIVLKDSEVREGASRIYEVSNTIAGGSKVMIKNPESEWIYIQYPIYYAGWIKKEDLGLY